MMLFSSHLLVLAGACFSYLGAFVAFFASSLSIGSDLHVACRLIITTGPSSVAML